MKVHPLGVLVALSFLVACGPRERGTSAALSAPDSLPSPAAPGSSAPNLHATADGRVLLTWLEPVANSRFSLKLAVHDGSEWSTPATVTEGESLFVNWADFPSAVILYNRDLLVHWLQRSGDGRYAYDVRVARSADGGRTWGASTVLHTDRTAAEHGFVSLWPIRADIAGAVWLDGRLTPDGKGEMMLMHRALGAGGASPEVELDRRVCDCCQTAVAVTSRGPVVVYRDRSADEIRDIAVVRHVDGVWSEPTLVHGDGWRIEACPVNGPAIAASGERVIVAWFTAANDTSRVLVAFSDDAGVTFATPRRIDGGAPAGRVAVAEDGGGGAFVSWIERTGGENAEVRVRHVSREGRLGEPAAVASSSAARASGFPRMARVGASVMFAWTDPGPPTTVRIARAAMERAP